MRTAFVDHPLRGDAVQYYAYALNLINHHTFSMALPDAVAHAPDNFRDPGYPVFLAIIGMVVGTGQAFYLTLLDVQALLGAVTVLIYALLVRRWIGFGPAIATAAFIALVARMGSPLADTSSARPCSASSWPRRCSSSTAPSVRERVWQAGLAGLIFAAAALTNAVALPFRAIGGDVDAVAEYTAPTILECLSDLRPSLQRLRSGARAAALPPGQSSGDRVAMNFVQGAWPEYHPEYVKSFQGRCRRLFATWRLSMPSTETLKANRLRRAAGHGRPDGRGSAAAILAGTCRSQSNYGAGISVSARVTFMSTHCKSPLTAGTVLRATTGVCFFLNPFILAIGRRDCLLALFRPSQTTPLSC